mmetsp:Transcript_30196/g.85283  ORF Transcript_30196/g.85283 Transcript_30196/m.85283 type:complete len:230 (-) Transcript_30196:501-1190(-)
MPDDHGVGHHRDMAVRHPLGGPHCAGVVGARHHVEHPHLALAVTYSSRLGGSAIAWLIGGPRGEREVTILHGEVPHGLHGAAGGGAALHGNLGELLHAHHVVAIALRYGPPDRLGGNGGLSDRQLRLVDEAKVLVEVGQGTLDLGDVAERGHLFLALLWHVVGGTVRGHHTRVLVVGLVHRAESSLLMCGGRHPNEAEVVRCQAHIIGVRDHHGAIGAGAFANRHDGAR